MEGGGGELQCVSLCARYVCAAVTQDNVWGSVWDMDEETWCECSKGSLPSA